EKKKPEAVPQKKPAVKKSRRKKVKEPVPEKSKKAKKESVKKEKSKKPVEKKSVQKPEKEKSSVEKSRKKQVPEKKPQEKDSEKAQKETAATSEKVQLSGLVFDKSDKTPLNKAKIETNVFKFPSWSDKDGKFVYPMKLKSGKYELKISAAGYKPLETKITISEKDVGQYEIKAFLALENSDKVSGLEAGKKEVAPTAAEKIDKDKKTSEDKKKTAVFRGTVIDAETGKPLSRENVVITYLKKIIITDENGTFTTNLPAGEYEIKIPVTGYSMLTEKVSLETGKILEKNFALSEKSKTERKKPIKKLKKEIPPDITPSAYTTNIPSLRYDPGTIIQGGSAYSNAYYFNGHRVPSLFHPISEKTLVPEELIKKLELKKAGYGSEYSDSTGASAELELIEPYEEVIKGKADMGLMDISVHAGGSVSEKASFLMSFQRGMRDVFAKLAYSDKDFIAYPEYYNGMLLYSHKFSQKNRLTAHFIASSNSVGFMAKDKKNGLPNLLRSTNLESSFFQFAGDWYYNSGNIKNRLSTNFNLENYTYHAHNGSDFFNSVISGTASDKISYKINDSNTIKGKLNFHAGFFEVDARGMLLPTEGETGHTYTGVKYKNPGYTGYIHPDIMISHIFSKGGFEIEPSVLLYADFHNKDYWDKGADPRLTASYNINEKIEIYGGGGLYSRKPKYDINGYVWGEEELLSEKSIHANIGTTASPFESLKTDLSLFYKNHYNLLRRDGSNPASYNNLGSAYSMGAEVSASYTIGETFAGGVTYAFAKHVCRDSEHGETYACNSDIPHILKLSALYNINKNWRLSGDFSLASGQVFTDVAGSRLDNTTGRYYPVFSAEKNTERLPASQTSRLRLERFFIVSHYKLSAYAEARQMWFVADKIYNADFSEYLDLNIIPLVATIGVTAEF
ncbi:MAG: carboxypeptidase-like regulatory domain-containing protein, partial [bacterium]